MPINENDDNGTIHANFLLSGDVAGQGTPLWWLAHHGWTNDFDAVESIDADGDGHTTWQEWIADTNPTNPASYLHVIAVSNLPPMQIHLPSSTNRVYSLSSSSDVTSTAPWARVTGMTTVPGHGGDDYLTYSNNPAGSQFWRIEVDVP